MNQETSNNAVTLYPPNTSEQLSTPPLPLAKKIGEVGTQVTLAIVGIGFAPVKSGSKP